MSTFVGKNPDMDFAQHNFRDLEKNGDLKWGSVKLERDYETLRAYQRLARLNLDFKASEELLRNGIHSANQIAKIPPRRFVREISQDTSFDEGGAQRLHDQAVVIQNKTYQAWASVNGTVASPVYRNSRFSNVSDPLEGVFSDLPSYEDLFGTLDFCNCEECRSIFGPAAYLVDLQRIILDYVTTPNEHTIPDGLQFPQRRPDIGDRDLTCQNTNSLLPYVQIINEVLMDYIAEKLNLADHEAVLKAIATSQVYPRRLPYNDPLNQIDVLLGQVGASFAQVLAAWGLPATTYVPRGLGISPDSEAILTANANTDAQVAAYYNVKPADLPTLSDPDVFDAITGLDFVRLTNLIQEDLSPDEIKNNLQSNLYINSGQAAGVYVKFAQDSVTKVWKLENLTTAALDAINRQLRIADTLGWADEEVDWALRAAMGGANPTLKIPNTSLVALGAMSVVKDRLSLTSLQAAALFGPIKTYGLGGCGGGSQFDCLFNTQGLATYHPSGNPLNPDYKTNPLPWTPGSTKDADVDAITRVLPGLSINLTEANLLGLATYGAVEQKLTVDVLSTLYRHSLIASKARLGMEQYVLLANQLQLSLGTPFTAETLGQLLDTLSWASGSGVTVYELDYVINGTRSVFVAIPYRPDTVPAWQISLIQQVTATDPDAQAVDITSQIAAFFGVQADQAAPCLAMAVANVEMPVIGITWQEAFLAVDSNGAPLYEPYVAAVLDVVARWLVLQESLSLSDATMANVAAYPAAYGMPTTYDLTLATVRLISSVQAMIAQFGDAQNKTLLYISQVQSGVSIDDCVVTLAQATSWPPEQSKLLIQGPVKDTSPVSAQLAAMERIFQLMSALGADSSLMGSITALGNATASSSWDSYNLVSQSVLAAVQSRYGSSWSSIYSTLHADMQATLRDALLSLAISELHTDYKDITTATDAYEYFLIDVKMGPETQVSYIKEALNACQLYLQRCHLELENGVDDLEIPPAYWEWMMNYRVWEANRQIFLYPENYLVPTLRPDPTPPFAKLQNDLLQSEVTPAYVDEGFQGYMEAFTEAAKIIPVQTYKAEVMDAQQGKVECTFVFGRSNTEPVTFFVASQLKDMPWSVWQKIDVSINSDSVTPIYAFGRLFIFWLEITKGSGSTIEASGGGSVSSPNYNVKVSINYTFQNASGNWVPPQSLVSEELVYYFTAGSGAVKLATEDIFSHLFDFTRGVWQNPAVLHVSAQNFPVPPPSQTAEKICVMYGPLLPNSATTVDPGPPPPTSDAYAYAFYNELERAALDHNQTVLGELSGYQLLRPCLVIDGMLEDSMVLHKEEYLLLDGYFQPAPLNQVNAQLSQLESSLLLLSSPTAVSDNLIADPNVAVIAAATAATMAPTSFITATIDPTLSQNIFNQLKTAGIIGQVDQVWQVIPDKLASTNLVTAMLPLIQINTLSASQLMDVQKTLFASIAGTPLFTNINPISSRVQTVKNQPGSFVLYSANEVFLLTPRQDPAIGIQPVFTPIDTSATVSAPLLTQVSFVSSCSIKGQTWAISSALSASIYLSLTSYNVIVNGVFNQSTTTSTLNVVLKPFLDSGQITSAQIQAIYNIGHNSALVTPDVFALDSQGLGSQTSTAIYDALAAYALIDPLSRVSSNLLSPRNLNLALANLLSAGTITPSTIPYIYQVLNEASTPTSVTYANEGNVSKFAKPADFIYNVSRLTTGAVAKLDQALFAGSVDALLSTKMQGYPVMPVLPFSRLSPQANVIPPRALDGTQVDFDGLYGEYFWEIFFHLPRLVSYMLQGNQRYEDAITWLQYIFNPTIKEEFVTSDVIVRETNGAISKATADEVIVALQNHSIGTPPLPILSSIGRVNPSLTPSTDLSFLMGDPVKLSNQQMLMVQSILLNYELSAPSSHYWLFFPFRTYTQESLQWILSDDNPAMRIYNLDPFDPYAIARLRIGAFEKATVMQYLDTLIAWGDMLFTMDTWETITAASLLYVYASDLLGPRPVMVGECPGSDVVVNFNDIAEGYAGSPGGIPQFLIDLEHVVPGGNSPVPIIGHAFNDLNVLFCVPENAHLMSYWDTVEDRMFKIQHSMNINGEFRTLALFEPPLNPLDLVRAAAAGSNVLPAMKSGAPVLPAYRFTSSWGYSMSVVEAVIGFGAELLSALEKQDAEGLGMLQTNQAGVILDMTVQMKTQAIASSQANINSLQASLASAQYRYDYYTQLIAVDLIPEETTGLDEMNTAMIFNVVSGALSVAASIGFAIPQFGSPFAMTYGGQQVGSVIQAAAQGMQIGGTIHSYNAERANTMGGYARRRQDWTLQQQIASSEVTQIQDSIVAAQAQLAMAQQDLATTKMQVQQNNAIVQYLTKKFTNQQLYSWMVSRLSAIYFQAFQLAMQTARAAESAYQFETLTSTSFIGFQYWNSLYKGLLAGEGLRAALVQMQTSFRNQDTRPLSVVKIVSLALSAPEALLELKTNGVCEFDLTEAMYDYDYPGQYARKITSVSVSIPAVIGPYQTVKAILTQTANQVVTAPEIKDVDYLLGIGNDPTSGLRTDWDSNQSIAISQAVDDSGMFVLNFGDERYLPFENTGAVSKWKLEMPKTTNRFDFDQLSDVILTVRYTARFDGSLQDKVEKSLSQVPYQGGIFIDCLRQQPSNWNAFMTDRTSSTDQTLNLAVRIAQSGAYKSLSVSQVLIRFNLGDGVHIQDGAKFLTLTAGTEASVTPSITANTIALTGLDWPADSVEGSWKFAFNLSDPQIGSLLTNGYIDPTKLQDMEVIVIYDAVIF